MILNNLPLFRLPEIKNKKRQSEATKFSYRHIARLLKAFA